MSNPENPDQKPDQTTFAKCRRGTDPLTVGQSCNSMSASITRSGQGATTFKCTKCNYSWFVQTGHGFNY